METKLDAPSVTGGWYLFTVELVSICLSCSPYHLVNQVANLSSKLVLLNSSEEDEKAFLSFKTAMCLTAKIPMHVFKKRPFSRTMHICDMYEEKEMDSFLSRLKSEEAEKLRGVLRSAWKSRIREVASMLD